MVDPTRPAQDYSGADRQEWQRLHRQETASRQRSAVAPRSASPSGSSSQDGASGSGTRGGGGGGVDLIAGAVGGAAGGLVGASSALGEKSATMSFWFVERVWPLKAIANLGERVAAAGSKTRFIIALPCSLVGVGIALGQGAQDPIVALLGLVIGAALGWAIPSVLGLMLALGAMLVGLAIGVALIAAALGLLYLAVNAAIH